MKCQEDWRRMEVGRASVEIVTLMLMLRTMTMFPVLPSMLLGVEFDGGAPDDDGDTHGNSDVGDGEEEGSPTVL